tara:strand:+ start:1572 stop:1850 length:279 start_codon:yes stop_codon:yes gene_type:complete
MISTTSTVDNQDTVLGVSTTFDTMLVIESLILSNPMMETLRDIGKLNKTSLMKMALMEFMATPVSTRKLRKLFSASLDDKKFRAVLTGGPLD